MTSNQQYHQNLYFNRQRQTDKPASNFYEKFKQQEDEILNRDYKSSRIKSSSGLKTQSPAVNIKKISGKVSSRLQKSQEFNKGPSSANFKKFITDKAVQKPQVTQIDKAKAEIANLNKTKKQEPFK